MDRAIPAGAVGDPAMTEQDPLPLGTAGMHPDGNPSCAICLAATWTLCPRCGVERTRGFLPCHNCGAAPPRG